MRVVRYVEKDIRGPLILVAVVVAVFGGGAAVAVLNPPSTSPDRVITCRILEETVSDGDSWTWWQTDRCGPLYAPEGMGSLFDGSYRAAIRDLEPGHNYRIRVHDVKKLLAARTHVVAVEGEVP